MTQSFSTRLAGAALALIAGTSLAFAQGRASETDGPPIFAQGNPGIWVLDPTYQNKSEFKC